MRPVRGGSDKGGILGYLGPDHAAQAGPHAAGHAGFQAELGAGLVLEGGGLDGLEKGPGSAGQDQAGGGVGADAGIQEGQKGLAVGGSFFLVRVYRDFFVNAVKWIAGEGQPVAEFHGQFPGGGVGVDIAHKGDDAESSGQEQGGDVGFQGQGIAQGTPEDDLIALGKPGKAGGCPAHHLKKEDEIASGDKADGKGTAPEYRREGLHGPEHDELAGMPLPPAGQGKAQGVKPRPGVGRAEGNEIQNRFPAEDRLIHGIFQGGRLRESGLAVAGLFRYFSCLGKTASGGSVAVAAAEPRVLQRIMA